MKALLFLLPFWVFAQSPAEIKITQAQAALTKDANYAGGHTALAMAFLARARETGDSKYLAQAEDAAGKALQLRPDDFEGLKARAAILLAEHRYGEALQLATKLNKRIPDDVSVYGLVADADMELGNYDEAEKSAQWMLDLRPGNLPGLIEGAKLREFFGDLDGALDFLKQAFQKVPPGEPEQQAWLAAFMGRLMTEKGDYAAAGRTLTNALKFYPDHPETLGVVGRLRAAEGNYPAAAEAFRARYEQTRQPAHLYDLAAALEKAGLRNEANRAFGEFESAAWKLRNEPNNANRQLVFYYVDKAGDPQKGLKLAEDELSKRQDIFTLDAAAWAMFKAGKPDDARKLMSRALKVGTRDREILRHAKELGLKQESQ